MESKTVANSMLVLRLLALLASTATVLVIVTNNVTFDNGAKMDFQYFKSYKFVVVVAVISVIYGIVQLPFAIYYAVKQKRLLNDGFMREFDFYGDKGTSHVMGIGVGVSFAVSIEMKKYIDYATRNAQEDVKNLKETYDSYFLQGIIASIVLFIAFISMLVLSFVSSNTKRTKTG